MLFNISLLFVYCCSFTGSNDGEMGGFEEFIYQSIVPACILAPLKPSFDLNDAQTVIVSNLISFIIS